MWRLYDFEEATEWPSAGIFSSEGGAVLGGHSMGKDSIARTLSLLNKLWDGAPHIVDRATAASFAVRGARLTISLQVQPHVLGDFLDRDRGMAKGSGFLARFLVAQPASLQGSRRYKEPAAMPDLGAFNARIGEMLEDLPTIDGERGLMLPLLELDPIAKAHWVTVYDSIEGQLSERRRLRGQSATLPQRRPTTSPVWHVSCTVSSTGRGGRSAYGRCRARPESSCGTPTAPMRCWRPSPCRARRRTRRRSTAG